MPNKNHIVTKKYVFTGLIYTNLSQYLNKHV